MKELYNKLKENINCELTNDEIELLYSADRINNRELVLLRDERNNYYNDLLKIYDKDKIATKKSEITEKTEVYIGELFIDKYYPTYNLKYIYEGLSLGCNLELLHLENLEYSGIIFISDANEDNEEKINEELLEKVLFNLNNTIIDIDSTDFFFNTTDNGINKQYFKDIDKNTAKALVDLPYMGDNDTFPSIFSAIPNNLKDKEMCLKTIKKNIGDIEFVPENLFDQEISKEAINNDSRIIHIPDQFLDRDMCIKGITNYIDDFEFVPDELIDREMCLYAVKLDGRNLKYVPEKLIDKDICLEAINNDPSAFKYVPYTIDCYNELFLEFVKNNGVINFDINFDALTRETILEAVKENDFILSKIPDKYKDEEICTEAINNSSYVALIKYVPINMKGYENVVIASMIKMDGDSVEYIPRELQQYFINLYNNIKQTQESKKHM